MKEWDICRDGLSDSALSSSKGGHEAPEVASSATHRGGGSSGLPPPLAGCRCSGKNPRLPRCLPGCRQFPRIKSGAGPRHHTPPKIADPRALSVPPDICKHPYTLLAIRLYPFECKKTSPAGDVANVQM